MRDKLCLRDGGPLVSAFRSLLGVALPRRELDRLAIGGLEFFSARGAPPARPDLGLASPESSGVEASRAGQLGAM